MYPGPFLTWIKRQAASRTICEARGRKGARTSRAAPRSITVREAGGEPGGRIWGHLGAEGHPGSVEFPGAGEPRYPPPAQSSGQNHPSQAPPSLGTP